MKIFTTIFLSLWSIQSYSMPFIPTTGAYTPETAKGILITLGVVVAVVLLLILTFKVIEFLFLSPPVEPLNFSIELEDYKDEDFKTLESRQLHIIYYENTAWDKEVP